MTAWPDPKWPQPAVRAKSSPDMLWPLVVDGTAMAAISGLKRAFGYAGDGRLGIEQRGQFAPACSRRRQLVRRAVGISIGPARQRDAGPLHPERAGVRLAVRGVVQHGDDVVEQVFGSQPKFVEVAMGGGGEVGATLCSAAVEVEAVVAEKQGEPARGKVSQLLTGNV